MLRGGVQRQRLFQRFSVGESYFDPRDASALATVQFFRDSDRRKDDGRMRKKLRPMSQREPQPHIRRGDHDVQSAILVLPTNVVFERA